MIFGGILLQYFTEDAVGQRMGRAERERRAIIKAKVAGCFMENDQIVTVIFAVMLCNVFVSSNVQ